MGELALVGFSVVNALSDEGYWLLYLGFSSSGSLFLNWVSGEIGCSIVEGEHLNVLFTEDIAPSVTLCSDCLLFEVSSSMSLR